MRVLSKVFSQRDPQWAGQRLGTVDGTTIGQYGCYVTCFAMLANYYQHGTTPALLNNLFTDKGWYAQGNLLTDDGLTKAFPDIIYQQAINYADTPADLNGLKTLLSDPAVSVVLEVDFDHDPSDGIQTHFVVAVDCDGKKVTIADPWYGSIDDFTKNYGNVPAQTILKFVIYKGLVAIPGGQMAVITQAELDNVRTERDKNYNNWQKDEEVIKNLNQTINDKNRKIDDLTSQINALTIQIANLNARVDSLTIQAKQLPDLQKQLAQSEKDRHTALDAQATQNRQIAQLKNSSYNAATVKDLVRALAKKVLRV